MNPKKIYLHELPYKEIAKSETVRLASDVLVCNTYCMPMAFSPF